MLPRTMLLPCLVVGFLATTCAHTPLAASADGSGETPHPLTVVCVQALGGPSCQPWCDRGQADHVLYLLGRASRIAPCPSTKARV